MILSRARTLERGTLPRRVPKSDVLSQTLQTAVSHGSDTAPDSISSSTISLMLNATKVLKPSVQILWFVLQMGNGIQLRQTAQDANAMTQAMLNTQLSLHTQTSISANLGTLHTMKTILLFQVNLLKSFAAQTEA